MASCFARGSTFLAKIEDSCSSVILSFEVFSQFMLLCWNSIKLNEFAEDQSYVEQVMWIQVRTQEH